MKRFSRRRFSQIMISKIIIQELGSLKEIIRAKTGVKHKLSYGDVIIALIKCYKNYLRTEYPLNQGLLVDNKLEKENLSVSIPITPKPFSASYKLDRKTTASISVES